MFDAAFCDLMVQALIGLDVQESLGTVLAICPQLSVDSVLVHLYAYAP